jgi:hypothetical protein
VLCAAATRATAQADTSRRGATSAPTYPVARSDDGGMSHSVNIALQRLMGSGGLPLPDHVDYHMGTAMRYPVNTDGGLPEMSRNRQGELDTLMSGAFRDAVRARTSRSSPIGS